MSAKHLLSLAPLFAAMLTACYLGPQFVEIPVTVVVTSPPVVQVITAMPVPPVIMATPVPIATFPAPVAPTPTVAPSAVPPPLPLPPITGRIAFVSEGEDGNELSVMNLELALQSIDRAGITRLTENMDRVTYPAWSPDGEKIAFLSSRDGLFVYVINADGSNLRLLTDTPATFSGLSWSPDSQQIAFSCDDQICVIDIDGSKLRRLTDPTSSGIYNTEPAWSPDGRTLVFMTNRAGGGPQIWAMDPDGRNARPLIPSPANFVSFSWSPTGEWIAFGTDAGPSGIYVMRADGSDLRQLTSSGYFPSWSPDGQWLALIAHYGGSDPSEIYRPRIFLVKVRDAFEGMGRLILVSPNEVVNDFLSWAPAGSP